MKHLVVVLALLSVSHGRTWEPPTYYVSHELPKLFVIGKVKPGERVIVSCSLPTVGANDPRTHFYHPGFPANAVPPTLKFQFLQPPKERVRYVVGTVERIEYDLRRRTNQVPGVLLLTSCSPLSEVSRFP
jgi:hypothetical protein